MKPFRSTPVCELREGQTIAMTQETIVIPPVRGHSVAKDKMEIVLRKGRTLRLVVWNRNRLIKVETDEK